MIRCPGGSTPKVEEVCERSGCGKYRHDRRAGPKNCQQRCIDCDHDDGECGSNNTTRVCPNVCGFKVEHMVASQ